nr:hypothetical protein [Pandoravirus aubagnensis]
MEEMAKCLNGAYYRASCPANVIGSGLRDGGKCPVSVCGTHTKQKLAAVGNLFLFLSFCVTTWARFHDNICPFRKFSEYIALDQPAIYAQAIFSFFRNKF